jgi:hypothetical protein
MFLDPVGGGGYGDGVGGCVGCLGVGAGFGVGTGFGVGGRGRVNASSADHPLFHSAPSIVFFGVAAP